MEVKRVALIWGGGGGSGSGYLIGRRLVLTASHAVGSSTKVRVWLVGPRRIWSAEVVWSLRYGSVDACLLRLIKLQPKDSHVGALLADATQSERLLADLDSPVQFARFSRIEPIAWACSGFPRAVADLETNQRESVGCYGIITLGGGLTNNRLELTVQHEPKENDGWQGLSGAAVLVQGKVVGVIGEVPVRMNRALWATPIERVLDQMPADLKVALGGLGSLPQLPTRRSDADAGSATPVQQPPEPNIGRQEANVEDDPELNTVDFFVSYTRADQQWAEWIAWTLEAADYRVTVQVWDIRPGHNFVREMHEAASKAARTICVLSPAYFESEYATAEWSAAFTADPRGDECKLVPVRIADCKPPGLLGSIVYIDLFDSDEGLALQRLLQGVQTGRAKPTEPPSFPGASPLGSSAQDKSPRPLFPGNSRQRDKTESFRTARTASVSELAPTSGSSLRQACARILDQHGAAYLIHELWAVTCSDVVGDVRSRATLEFPWGRTDAVVYARYEHVAFLKVKPSAHAKGVQPLNIRELAVEPQTVCDVWDVNAAGKSPQHGVLVAPYKPDGSQSLIEIRGNGIEVVPGTLVCVGDRVIGHLLPRRRRSSEVIEAFPVQRLRIQLREVYRGAMQDEVAREFGIQRQAFEAFVHAAQLDGLNTEELAARLLDREQTPDNLLRICADALGMLSTPDGGSKRCILNVAMCALPALYELGSIHESRVNGGSSTLLEIDWEFDDRDMQLEMMLELELIMAAYDIRDARIKHTGSKRPALMSDLGKVPWGKGLGIRDDGAIADLRAKLAVRLDLANRNLPSSELDKRIRTKLEVIANENRLRYYWTLPEYASNELVSKVSGLYPSLRIVRRRNPQRTDEESLLYETVKLLLNNVLYGDSDVDGI